MMQHRREVQFIELRYLSFAFILGAFLIIFKLVTLQVVERNYYSTLALSSHEIYQKIHPERGKIFFQDSRTGQTYPVAVNRRYYKVYAIPKEIAKEEIQAVVDKLKEILQIPEEDIAGLTEKLSKSDDPYEPIAKKIDEDTVEQIKSANLKGIYFTNEIYRYYPEESDGAAVLGFCSYDEEENPKGNYGVEGYWNKFLSGKTGFLSGERAAKGGLISLAGLTSVEAENGADIILTIDRALQHQACQKLSEGFSAFGALSASLIIMDPQSGAILAMCSFPSYDPNNYSKVEDFGVYNNRGIFTPYEPGSVFKPIVMSIAIDQNIVSPNTTFNDPCERKFDKYTIHNAQNKCYGSNVTMTEVLEHSINTGMIWVAEKVKRETVRDYIQKFGFGQKSGVPMDTEMAGNISSLDSKSPIFVAQASFGQGLTVTPLQLALAYSAFANDGILPKPYLVKEIDYSNGKIEKFEPEAAGQVIAPRTAKLIGGMLTSVVENTYEKSVKMSDYFIAGKTGTAQIPGPGGYKEETNHTFAGFVPATNPKLVAVIRYEAPMRQWAESTAAVTFKKIAEFALDYLGVEEDKK